MDFVVQKEEVGMIVRALSVTSFVLTGLLLAACASDKEMSGDTVSGKDVSVSGTGTRTTVADTPLQACLKSIPKESSVGQRSFAEQTCQRDFGTSSKDTRPSASGAVDDTLQACMARIPKDASSGQRMMAERSCQRDAAAMKGGL
jgi:hypothetical protein